MKRRDFVKASLALPCAVAAPIIVAEEKLTEWPDGFVSEILTLLDRIEIEEDDALASQRFDICEKYGLTVQSERGQK